MRKYLPFLVLLISLAASAATDEALGDPHQEARAHALGEELRCVVCQSESINDSQADMARDMRLLVREKIHQGWSDQQILDFARARYGDFILLKPPMQGNTYLLWGLPLLILGIGGLVAYSLLKRRDKTQPGNNS